MNYERSELLDPVAAAYVVGSLRGRARTRFERLCRELPAALRARQRWEERLLPIALSIPPVTPRSNLLPGIRARLNLAAPGASPTAGVTRRRWLSLAAAASILMVVGIIARLVFFPGITWQPMATLALNNAPTWSVERSADNSRILMRTTGRPAPGTDKDYELWLLPVETGASPVSLGVMPRSGTSELRLNDRQRALMAAVKTLAITLEPLGGSPSGLPTGAVVSTGAVSSV
jgi:anti-sigma-K factor RskA